MILAVILDVFRCSINCGIFKAWHYLNRKEMYNFVIEIYK